jgi:hypothetical protein
MTTALFALLIMFGWFVLAVVLAFVIGRVLKVNGSS